MVLKTRYHIVVMENLESAGFSMYDVIQKSPLQYPVRIAGDTKELVSEMSFKTIDILIVDVDYLNAIPGMSLKDLAGIVPHIPMIAVSESGRTGLAVDALQQGAIDFWCKPEVTAGNVARFLGLAHERFIQRKKNEIGMPHAAKYGKTTDAIKTGEFEQVLETENSINQKPASAVNNSCSDFGPVPDLPSIICTADAGDGCSPPFMNTLLGMVPNGQSGSVPDCLETGKVAPGLSPLHQEDKTRQGLQRLENARQAAEKMIAIGEMTSKISHEFRNALSSVKMILELVNENQALESERNSIGIALQGVEHMEHIIARLLHFSRPGPYNFRPEDINAITETALSLCSVHFVKNDIDLVKLMDDDIPAMYVDKILFEEALLNLLLNAVQAFSCDFPGKKQITVKTCRITMRQHLTDYSPKLYNGYPAVKQLIFPSRLVIKNNSPCVLVQIIDNGPGIDAPSLKRIFEPFFTQKPKGTGLGLSIVKQTVNAHGGIIKVTSLRGEGTTFSIYLPINSQGKVR